MPNFPAFPTLSIGPYGPIAPGVVKPTKAAVLTANFGGRYSQRSGDGVNPVARNFQYRTILLPADKLKILDDFLLSRKGYLPFTYLLPYETVARQFICSEWSVEHPERLHSTISGLFEENFDP
jgi:phage-related protein